VLVGMPLIEFSFILTDGLACVNVFDLIDISEHSEVSAGRRHYSLDGSAGCSEINDLILVGASCGEGPRGLRRRSAAPVRGLMAGGQRSGHSVTR
jgi:hypothetical protein